MVVEKEEEGLGAAVVCAESSDQGLATMQIRVQVLPLHISPSCLSFLVPVGVLTMVLWRFSDAFNPDHFSHSLSLPTRPALPALCLCTCFCALTSVHMYLCTHPYMRYQPEEFEIYI